MVAAQVIGAVVVLYTLICAVVVFAARRSSARMTDHLRRLEVMVDAHENMIDINGRILDDLKRPLRHPSKGYSECYREPAPRCRHCGQVLS